MNYFCIEKDYGIDALRLKEKPVPRYSRNLPLPLIPLSDAAGEVVEVGAGVACWQPGDRVAGTFFQDWDGGGITGEVPDSALGGAIDGVLAEYVLFRERGLVPLPAHLSFEEGATLPCAALTAGFPTSPSSSPAPPVPGSSPPPAARPRRTGSVNWAPARSSTTKPSRTGRRGSGS